jgi:hypothetical protein
LSAVSGEEAALTSDEVEEERAAGEEAVEEGDAAVPGGEGEALRSFLEVGIVGLCYAQIS